MAIENAKTLNVRIKNKYDSYENWAASGLVLEAGEIAIAYTTVNVAVDNGSIEQHPALLMKVGDGEKTFANLPWLSAKAADVPAYAKKSEDDFKAWIKTIVTIDDVDTSAFALAADLNDEIERAKAAEAQALTDANGYTDGLNTAMDARVKVVEGKAHVHTNAAELAKIVEGDKAKWDAMEQNAKDYADDLDEAMDSRVQALEAKFGDGEGNVASQIESAVAAEKTDREAADTALGNRVKAIEDDYLKAADKTALQDQITANDGEIAALQGLVGTTAVETQITNAVDASAATLNAAIEAVDEKADKAQAEVDAVELDMGDVDALSTENKTVVGAINEVLAAVGTGGTAAVVTITSDTTTEGALKSYTIKQGTATVGVIDIPKDMVVESGSVVTNPEGQDAGTYIKLVLANVTEPLYINVGTLVDIYVAKADAAQVQVAIDSATREISAAIVAGSVTATELADNAVVTAKIADANVTKAKLSTAVQASLDKADAAATKAEFDEEVTRAKAAEAQALTDAKAYTDEKVGAEKTRAEGIETGLDTRLTAVETKVGNTPVADQITAAIEALKIGDYAKAADLTAAINQHNTDKTALETEIAKKANDADLAAIAKTGSTDNLVQGEMTLVFDCGTSAG